jgi:hypothetical protein
MTLIELTVTSAVMLMVVGSILALLDSTQTAVGRQQDRSGNTDQARAAFEELDREVRSGIVLYDPALETDATGASIAGYGLRVYSETNAPTRNANTPLCVQWRIANDQLVRRTWPASDPTAATSWAIVATSIVNRSVSPGVPAFALDPAAAFGGRVVDVTLLVNTRQGTTAKVQQTVRLQGAFSIRDQANVNPCSAVPPG